MTIPVSNSLYTSGYAISPSVVPVFEARDPTSSDLQGRNGPFKMQQTWVNTLTQGIWVLETLNASQGVISATWRAVAPIVVSTAAPTTADYQYPLGQLWMDTATSTAYILVAISGTTATWDPFGGPTAGDISFLTGDSGGAVTGNSSGNVNIVGASGQIVVTGSPSTNTLTLSLSGGGEAVDSFTPDTGTSPVVPSATGLVALRGQVIPNVSGIQVTGGLNSLSLSMLSPFVSASNWVFSVPVVQNSNSTAINSSFQALNTNNSSTAAQATILATVGGTSAGDAFFQASDSVNYWSWGLRHGTSGQFQVSAGSSLGASIVIQITQGGIINEPLQPTFGAYQSPTVANATGDGTVYTIIFNSALYDQASNFNATTGTFTAPAKGIYTLASSVTLNTLGAGHTTGLLQIVTTNRTYTLYDGNIGAARDAANIATISGCVLADMSAGDTATVTITISGSTKTVGIQQSSSSLGTMFWGTLNV